jgi:hypothetical protein
VWLQPAEQLPGMKLFFDWARNLHDQALTIASGGLETAWSFGIKLGQAKKKGSWELGHDYRYVDPNAIPGVFADGDFGFVNKRGSVIQAKYALTEELLLRSAGYFTNNITVNSGQSAIPAANLLDEETRLFQSDLIWAF